MSGIYADITSESILLNLGAHNVYYVKLHNSVWYQIILILLSPALGSLQVYL